MWRYKLFHPIYIRLITQYPKHDAHSPEIYVRYRASVSVPK